MIHIHFEGQSAAQIRAEMLALIGSTSLTSPASPQPPADNDHVAEGATPFAPESELLVEAQDAKVFTQTASAINAASARERGKPSPGHARRTKAEIAEDEAYEATQTRAVSAVAIKDVDTDIITPAISTGEERIGPEDDAETAAQDAADEAAETAATKAPDKLTLDDVRNAMGVYATTYGMAAVQADGQEVFKRVLGECTLKDDKGTVRGWRASDLTDEAAIAKIVAGFGEMTTKNPFKRDVVGKVA